MVAVPQAGSAGSLYHYVGTWQFGGDSTYLGPMAHSEAAHAGGLLASYGRRMFLSSSAALHTRTRLRSLTPPSLPLALRQRGLHRHYSRSALWTRVPHLPR